MWRDDRCGVGVAGSDLIERVVQGWAADGEDPRYIWECDPMKPMRWRRLFEGRPATDCPACDGRGRVFVVELDPPRHVECETCSGRGFLVEEVDEQ